jgi:hypothetical protein
VDTASLTVCQSQASSAATSLIVRPSPIWRVAHFAALVVNKQFLAAMRWSESTQLALGHAALAQRIRCFFQHRRIGDP